MKTSGLKPEVFCFSTLLFFLIFFGISMGEIRSSKKIFSGPRSQIHPGFVPLILGCSRHPWLRSLRNVPAKYFWTLIYIQFCRMFDVTQTPRYEIMWFPQIAGREACRNFKVFELFVSRKLLRANAYAISIFLQSRALQELNTNT